MRLGTLLRQILVLSGLSLFPALAFAQTAMQHASVPGTALSIPNRGMQAGIGNWMEIADNPSIAIPVFTVEVWVKSSSGGLIVTRDHSSGTPSDWQLWYEFSRKRLAFITAQTPPDSYFYTPDGSFLADTWYHVALVVNGPAGYARLYINGNLSISPTFTPRYFDCNTGLAWCGYYNNASGAYLQGEIDEARYWNIERTVTQIRGTRNIDIPANDRQGLVGWWRFCDSYEDYSGMGNHGTPRGNPQLVLNTLPFGITCNNGPCDSISVTITGNPFICENDTTTLTASAGFASYRWTTGDSTRSIRVTKPGSYGVEVVDDSGCIAHATFDVSTYPQPVANAGPDIVVCTNVQAMLGAMTPVPGWTYRWSPPDGLSDPDSAVTAVQTGMSQRYILTVITDNGCVDADTVDVTVRSGLDLSLPDSLHICPGISVRLPLEVLSGAPPFRYLWTPSASLSGSDLQKPMANPPGSQWYHVRVTDSLGCFEDDSILVVRTAGLETLLPDSLVICENGSVVLPLIVRSGKSPFMFQWTPADGLSAADVQNPVASPDSTRWYYVTVQDSLGCMGRDSVRLVVADRLQTTLPDSLYICANGSVAIPLEVTGGGGTLTFDWTPEADLSNPHTQKPVARPKQATLYRVHVSDATGCEARDSIVIALYPKTDISISIGGSSTFCLGDSVLLTATSGFGSYRWTTPSRVIPDTGSTIIAREAGRYYVSVIDSHGCESTSQPVTLSTFNAFQIPVALHGSQPLCPGDSLVLEAVAGYRDYLWTDDSGRVIGTGQFVRIGKAGRYSVTATDSSGCIGSSLPVDVAMGTKPVFSISGPKIVCINSQVEYSTLYRSRWAYQWSADDAEAEPPTDKQAVRLRWATPGRKTVRLRVQDTQSGCSDSAAFTVDVISELHPEIQAGGSTVFCEGDSVTLRSRLAYDIGEWRDSTGTLRGSGSVFVVRESGMYYFHAGTLDGCSGVDSIRVIVHPAPRPDIAGRTTVCQGDTVTYALQGTSGVIGWTFSGGTLLHSDQTNATIWWDKPGTYTILVTETGTDTEPPCIGSSLMQILVHPAPEPVLAVLPDSVICENEWVTLIASAGHSRYIWSTPDGVVDTTVNELRVNRAGTYRLTVVSAEGCIGTSVPVGISVLPAPDALIDGPVTICRDGTASYSARSQAGVIYQWAVTGGTGQSDPTASTFEILWSAAGTGMVVLSVDNGSCQAYDTLLVQVGDTLKPVISGNGPYRFCEGGEVELDAGAGYASCYWNTPGGIVPGRTLVVRESGRYSVHVSSAGGCEGTSDVIDVEVLPAPHPLITGPDGLCAGDTAVLEAAAGYVSYQWDDGTTGRFCVIHGSCDRRVTVVDSSGCVGVSDVHHVAYYPLPIQPVITRHNGILECTPAATYQWYRNDTLLAGETAKTCSPGLPGRYFVETTNGQGCPSGSDALIIACVEGSTVLALPHLIVSPGDTVDLGITLLESLCMEEFEAEAFTAAIRFNKTLLTPIEDTPAGSIDGADRVIDFSASADALEKRALGLRFLATLGNADSIPLIFETFQWLDVPAAVTLLDGSLRMRICQEGGKRLFDSEGQVRLAQNRPNPFNANTIIEFEVIESGSTEVYVLNTLGRRVRTLFHANAAAGTYLLSFDASELPSGNYVCVLQTPTVTVHRTMLLVK